MVGRITGVGTRLVRFSSAGWPKGQGTMNANSLAKNYDRLTAEERFRLILAASERGDEAERERLANAGQRIRLSMPDHVPYAEAFEDLALLTFIELAEDAA